jgi:hypothetical protein
MRRLVRDEIVPLSSIARNEKPGIHSKTSEAKSPLALGFE